TRWAAPARGTGPSGRLSPGRRAQLQRRDRWPPTRSDSAQPTAARSRSFERDHELADPPALPRQPELACTNARLLRPAVLGNGSVAVLSYRSDLQLIVGRARFVGVQDRRA